MKHVLLVLIALGLAACSSTYGRKIASVDNCYVEKHKNSELYRIVIDGQPYNKFWYKQNDASEIMNRLADKGKCN